MYRGRNEMIYVIYFTSISRILLFRRRLLRLYVVRRNNITRPYTIHYHRVKIMSMGRCAHKRGGGGSAASRGVSSCDGPHPRFRFETLSPPEHTVSGKLKKNFSVFVYVPITWGDALIDRLQYYPRVNALQKYWRKSLKCYLLGRFNVPSHFGWIL